MTIKRPDNGGINGRPNWTKWTRDNNKMDMRASREWSTTEKLMSEWSSAGPVCTALFLASGQCSALRGLHGNFCYLVSRLVVKH
ncbi:hypothetical protein ElyMa_004741900 [Elysia marginata]|uniref:Uncharacterized protein n=1 Tax=Elysia marginata TaxID=1093978 RepID=A0AAV4IGU1_9GAST|nr:hypothetical protein ElyMa_004741900 [Elysia marginata]